MIVHEWFVSIDGECNRWGQGAISMFIRFAGCNLKCSYCDTKDSQGVIGNNYSVSSLVNLVKSSRVKKVTITGGEPLLQPDILIFIRQLLTHSYKVSLETNGTINPPRFNTSYYNIVMDYKLHNPPTKQTLSLLRTTDYLKFVVENEKSLDGIIKKIKNDSCIGNCKAQLLISPAFGSSINLNNLIDRLVKEGLAHVNLNFQLHKLLNLR